MNVLIVGSSQATKEQAEPIIKKFLEKNKDWFNESIIVNSDCKGIDRIVNETAYELGFETNPITRKTLGLNGNYWEDIRIANDESARISNIAFSFVLPLGTSKGRGRCTWCKRAGLDYNHEKSSGCKTALQVPNHQIVVLENE
tara:strand:- start:170 stop:598 length:429 start_codon:yes stop_codon:yes gene_type:complete